MSSQPKNFSVDIVFTWVDGHDPEWRQRKSQALKRCGLCEKDQLHPEAASEARFSDNNELKYSLRSIELYAPWVRNIFLITDRQSPTWLNHKRVTVVDHQEIFPSVSYLPTFNSHAIELCLHRIEGLAENFVYFNDDFMLARTTKVSDFFLEYKKPLIWAVTKSLRKHRKLISTDYRSMNPHRAGETRSRNLIKDQFGVVLPYRIRHFPRAMTRSDLQEICELNASIIQATLSSPFRTINDFAMFAYYPLYMLANRRGILRPINGVQQFIDILCLRIRHLGASLGDSNYLKKMNLIKRFKPLTFCINDCDNAKPADKLILAKFFEELFPNKSSFEI